MCVGGLISFKHKSLLSVQPQVSSHTCLLLCCLLGGQAAVNHLERREVRSHIRENSTPATGNSNYFGKNNETIPQLLLDIQKILIKNIIFGASLVAQ